AATQAAEIFAEKCIEAPVAQADARTAAFGGLVTDDVGIVELRLQKIVSHGPGRFLHMFVLSKRHARATSRKLVPDPPIFGLCCGHCGGRCICTVVESATSRRSCSVN